MGEVPLYGVWEGTREEKNIFEGTDPESRITTYTLVYEENIRNTVWIRRGIYMYTRDQVCTRTGMYDTSTAMYEICTRYRVTPKQEFLGLVERLQQTLADLEKELSRTWEHL